MTAPAGIDVSRYQGQVDWPAVKRAGVTFAVAKATQGTGYVDPMFARNWAGMKAAGLKRSAYHFAEPGKPPVAQAEHFVHTVGKLGHDDLPLVLDLEATTVSGSATVAWATAFLNRLDELTARRSIIYTGPGFVSGLGSSTVLLTKWPLWVAHYTDAAKPRTGPWKTWLWWQHSSTGSVPGIAGHVDINRAAAMPDHPDPQPQPDLEEDDLPLHLIRIKKTPPGAVFVTDWLRKRPVSDSDMDMIFFPKPHPPILELPEDQVNRIPSE